jgi:hypothetical protein
MEALKVRIVPLIVTERLFVKVSEEMKRLNANVQASTSLQIKAIFGTYVGVFHRAGPQWYDRRHAG